MRLLHILVIFVLAVSSLSSQELCYLYGQFKEKNLALHCHVRVDQRDYDGLLNNYEVELSGNDPFWIPFYLDRPQEIKLIYARNEMKIFVEPGDTVYIDIDPDSFLYNSSLKGSNGRKNEILNNFYSSNNSPQRRSDRLQFKYGDFWYHTSVTINNWMREMDGQSFLKHMSERKLKWHRYLIDQQTKYPEAFDKELESILSSEIYFDWAYHMLVYTTSYAGRHGLDSSYIDFMEEVDVSLGHLVSQQFRRYLMAMTNYHYENIEAEKKSYKDLKRLTDSLLVGEDWAYVLSEHLVRDLRAGDNPDFIEYYYEFMNTNTFLAFSERVSRKLNEQVHVSVGTVVPEFSLENQSGTMVNLSEFAGSPCIVTFWATWCKPCISKMDSLREFKSEIDMLFINLDNSHELFLSALTKHNPPGVQLYSPKADQTEMLKKYGVKFLPGTFLVDRNGRYALVPSSFSFDRLRKYLKSNTELGGADK